MPDALGKQGRKQHKQQRVSRRAASERESRAEARRMKRACVLQFDVKWLNACVKVGVKISSDFES